MKPFEISVVVAMALGAGVPAGSPAPETRLFELREYHAAPGRIQELHDRFRTHTVRLLEKHGVTSIGYFVSPEGGDDVLRVILAYPHAAARKRSWESFVVDPDWQQARRGSDARGRLVEKIRELPLTPTADCPHVISVTGSNEWAYEVQMSLPKMGLPNPNSPLTPGEKLVGSWTTSSPQPAEGDLIVRLIARKPVPPVSPTRETFFRGPVEPTPNVRQTAAKANLRETPVRSLTLVPTDYSPIK